MRRKEIERLQSIQGFPALTITLPTYRTAPDVQQNPIRLKNLTNQAQSLVREQCDTTTGAALLNRMQSVIEGLEAGEFQDGLAIFVHSEFADAFTLPFALPERVVLDEGFLTRDLVLERRRTVRYWVVALSDHTRLFAGTTERVKERAEGPFPVVYEDSYQDPAVSGARDTKHDALEDERQRQFLRQVDAALTEVLQEEELPVVLLGVTRNLAYFEEITENGEHIAGKAEGNYDHANTDKIAAVAWEALQPYLAAEQQEIARTWEDSVSGGRFVSGLKDAWEAAFDGRGDLLLVEEGFQAAGRVDESGRELTVIERQEGSNGGESRGAQSDVRYDVVDDLIELVWSRGGRVRFVPPGMLSGGEGVGLALRY